MLKYESTEFVLKEEVETRSFEVFSLYGKVGLIPCRHI